MEGDAFQGQIMRRAARIDGSQTAIVEALRAAGCSVAITSALGGGFPDLVVGRDDGWINARVFLLEVKDPSQPPSKRKLTKAEQKFKDNWCGHYAVVETPEEALRAVGIYR